MSSDVIPSAEAAADELTSTSSNPASSRHAALSVPLAVLVGSVGYLVGVLALAYDPALSLADGFRVLLLPPERAIWSFLVAAQTALWMLLLSPICLKLRAYRGDITARPIGLAAFAAGFGILLTLFLLSHQTLPDTLTFPVTAQKSKIGAITVVGAAIMALTLIGILGVGTRAAGIYRAAGSGAAEIGSFLAVRRDLRGFLLMAGLVIGAATLSTGALHRALAVLNPPELFAVNPTMILLYGAFGSGVIALVYVPAHILVNDVGRRIADSLSPLRATDAASLIGWHRERHELEAVLDLKATPWENLRSALAILYPLLGSAVSLLLGLGR
jgi:hypothetical protein